MILLGVFTREVLNAAAAGNTARASTFGAGAAAMVFIFTAVFGATWLTVPWLYPAEIFPLAVRAKGNAWGVVGWSIGNGWTVLLTPVRTTPTSHTFTFSYTNKPSLPDNVQQYPRENLLHLRRMQRPHHPHRLGLISRIQPTHPRRNGPPLRG